MWVVFILIKSHAIIKLYSTFIKGKDFFGDNLMRHPHLKLSIKLYFK